VRCVADGLTRHVVEVKAGTPNDPDGSRAAAILSAYFEAEHARDVRRRLCYRLAIVGVMWGVLTAWIQSSSAFLAGVLVIGVAVSYALFIEWWTDGQLTKLIRDEQIS
jgi:hypothetical protein